MGRYAKNTCVSSEKSRAEIEKILSKYGASQFMYGWKDEAAIIAFHLSNRRVQFILHLPNKNSRKFTHTPSKGRERSPAQIEEAYEQAIKQKWRSLALCIKGKLVSVEDEIEMFEDAFMANIVLPGGARVGEWMRPQIAKAYESGEMPKLLPMIEA